MRSSRSSALCAVAGERRGRRRLGRPRPSHRSRGERKDQRVKERRACGYLQGKLGATSAATRRTAGTRTYATASRRDCGPPGASTRSALPPAVLTRLAKCSTPGLSASLSPTSRRIGPDCPLSRAAIASSLGPTAGLWPPTPEKTPGCIATARSATLPPREIPPTRAIGRVGERAVGLVRPRHEMIDEIGGQARPASWLRRRASPRSSEGSHRS